MTVHRASWIALAVVVVAALGVGARAEDEAFRDLFDGESLAGWVNVNCAPGTFTVEDGEIRSTGVPTGVMRTDRQYENFVLELEWMHERPKGNAGLFVWSQPITAPGVPFAQAIEVQILDGRETENYTSHGDVFGIHGATMVPDRPHPNGWMRCLPSEKRCRPAGEWNHYRVSCVDGRVELAVNGKVVSGASRCSPRKGYICLESEGSPARFRRIRIRELPSTGATRAESAEAAQFFRPLYTGVDLSGWRSDSGAASAWEARDWTLVHPARAAAAMWTEESFEDLVLIADWRLAQGAEAPLGSSAAILLRGPTGAELGLGRFAAGSGRIVGPLGAPVRDGYPAHDSSADAPIGQWNRTIISLRGDRVRVELNGVVVEEGRLPELPVRGPIGLEPRGGAIELASLLVLEAPATPDLAAREAYESRELRLAAGPLAGETFRYRLLRPRLVEPGRRYPLVLFLHGAGERGDDNERPLKFLPEQLARREWRDRFPAFVLAPQCRGDRRWVEVDWSATTPTALGEPSPMMLGAEQALREVLASEPIDPLRVHVTGLSMGGYGTWDIATRHPDWFASAVPICGGGDDASAARLVGLPLWAFHGDADGVVPVGRTRGMIAAIRAAGGEPRYTELPGVGHNAWSPAYGDPRGVVPWIFSQERESGGPSFGER